MPAALLILAFGIEEKRLITVWSATIPLPPGGIGVEVL